LFFNDNWLTQNNFIISSFYNGFYMKKVQFLMCGQNNGFEKINLISFFDDFK